MEIVIPQTRYSPQRFSPLSPLNAQPSFYNHQDYYISQPYQPNLYPISPLTSTHQPHQPQTRQPQTHQPQQPQTQQTYVMINNIHNSPTFPEASYYYYAIDMIALPVNGSNMLYLQNTPTFNVSTFWSPFDRSVFNNTQSSDIKTPVFQTAKSNLPDLNVLEEKAKEFILDAKTPGAERYGNKRRFGTERQINIIPNTNPNPSPSPESKRRMNPSSPIFVPKNK